MNKTIYIFTITILIVATIIVSRNSPSKKTIKIQEKVNQETKFAVDDYGYEYLQFIKMMDDKIASNEKSISELEARKEVMERKEFGQQVAILEQRNMNMKNRIYAFKLNGHTEWITFLNKYCLDMDELDKSFKDFFYKTSNEK